MGCLEIVSFGLKNQIANIFKSYSVSPVITFEVTYSYQGILLDKPIGIMSVTTNAIDACIKQCYRSPMRSRHGAAIIYRGKVVAAAKNDYVSGKRPYDDCRSIHAEVAVIIEFLKRYPRAALREATLVVVRVTRDGELSCSRPCSQCTQTINKYNVGKVVHS